MADSPAAERRLDEAAVRALVQEVAPELSRLPLRLVAEGWDNSTWRLGDRWAVRLPRRALAAPLIVNEQRALVEIGPLLQAVGVLSPIPIIAGRPTAQFPWPWSVVPWISGATAVGADRRQAARWAPALAAALGALHVPAPPDAPHNPVRGVPLALRDEVMRTRLADARRAGLAQYEVLRDAWTAGLHADTGDERVWVHGDLHPGNIVVNGGALTALIDFGDVTAGDPAYDLAVTWMLLDFAGRAQFRSATGTRYDEATWMRARAWAAYLALVLLTQSDDRPDLLGVGLGTAEELARS